MSSRRWLPRLEGCSEPGVVPFWFERRSAHPFRLKAAALIVSPYVLTATELLSLLTAPYGAHSLHLPAIMRKRLVGVGHLVRIFALLDRVALVGRSVEQLARQLLLHGAAVGALASRLDDPAHAERHRALRPHVDRHLVGGATDAAGFHLDLGLHVAEGAVPDL